MGFPLYWNLNFDRRVEYRQPPYSTRIFTQIIRIGLANLEFIEDTELGKIAGIQIYFADETSFADASGEMATFANLLTKVMLFDWKCGENGVRLPRGWP